MNYGAKIHQDKELRVRNGIPFRACGTLSITSIHSNTTSIHSQHQARACSPLLTEVEAMREELDMPTRYPKPCASEWFAVPAPKGEVIVAVIAQRCDATRSKTYTTPSNSSIVCSAVRCGVQEGVE